MLTSTKMKFQVRCHIIFSDWTNFNIHVNMNHSSYVCMSNLTVTALPQGSMWEERRSGCIKVVDNNMFLGLSSVIVWHGLTSFRCTEYHSFLPHLAKHCHSIILQLILVNFPILDHLLAVFLGGYIFLYSFPFPVAYFRPSAFAIQGNPCWGRMGSWRLSVHLFGLDHLDWRLVWPMPINQP